MKPKEVSDRLALDNVAKNHTWKVEPSCATTGDGIFEGLVSNAMNCAEQLMCTTCWHLAGVAIESHQDNCAKVKRRRIAWEWWRTFWF